MTTEKPSSLGKSLKKLKDLPKSIITHMPFVMFRPMTIEKDGKTYAIMDFLYFYQDLMVTSPFENGQYFDEMPQNDTLSFDAISFKKKVGLRVIRNTYYFNTDLTDKKLLFRMYATEKVLKKYNDAHPKNPIGLDGYVEPTDGLPMFFTADCEIVIPPPSVGK